MKPFDVENTNKMKSGFKVPDSYFEQFEVKMMEKILEEKDTKVVRIFSQKQIWISSIAAVFLIAIAIPVYYSVAKESVLDASTIENYLAQQRISTTELTKHLTNEDINALEKSLSLNEQNLDAVEDYLSESENLEYNINEY